MSFYIILAFDFVLLNKKEGILSPFWEIIYLLSILYDTRVKSSKSCIATEQFVGIITTIMKQEHIHDYK